MELWGIDLERDGEKLSLFGAKQSLVASFKGFGVPPIQIISKAGYRQDGAVFIQSTYGTRNIILRYVKENVSRNVAELDVLRLVEFLRITKNSLIKLSYYTDSGEKFIYATLSDFGETPTINDANADMHAAAQDHMVDLFCADPIWYGDLHEFTVTLAVQEQWVYDAAYPNWYDKDPSTIKINQEIDYQGTYKSYPKITITGPASSFVFKNNTTGYYIILLAAIPAGEVLTINTDYTGIVLSDDYYYGFTKDSSPLQTYIEPGINHLIFQLGGTNVNSKLEVQYHDRYEGIM